MGWESYLFHAGVLAAGRGLTALAVEDIGETNDCLTMLET